MSIGVAWLLFALAVVVVGIMASALDSLGLWVIPLFVVGCYAYDKLTD